MGKKREQASHTFNPKAFCVGHHLDAVNRSAGQAICLAQDLDWTNQVQLLDWRHDQNDDAPLLI